MRLRATSSLKMFGFCPLSADVAAAPPSSSSGSKSLALREISAFSSTACASSSTYSRAVFIGPSNSHACAESRARHRRPCCTVGLAPSAGTSAGVRLKTRLELDTNMQNPWNRELLPPFAPETAMSSNLRASRYSKSRSDDSLVMRMKAT